MRHDADEMLRILTELDVRAMRAYWRGLIPDQDQPVDEVIELLMHQARVETPTLSEKLRAYSRAWLAERNNTIIVRGVGIAVSSLSGERDDQAKAIERAMAHAVEQAVREGVSLETDTEEIRRRMRNAGEREGLARVLIS